MENLDSSSQLPCDISDHEVIGEPPSPELMEEDDDEFLHRTKTSISGKTEQPRLTKTLGVPLKELVKKAPHGSAVTKTFGVPLEDLVKRAPPGSTVPTFVCKVLDYINSRGYIEQLFIRDGQKNVVEKLKNRFDADGDADFEFEQETDILAVGQLLKVFLYELPKPIFPTEVIPDLEKPTDDDAEVGGAYHLTKAMLVLPDTHWHLLKFLTQSLQRIIMPRQPLSGMAAAIVPSLTRPHVSARSRNGSILTRVVVSCIVNTYDIFDEDKETTRELLEKSERSQMALQIEHMAYKRGRFRRLPSSKTSQQQVKSTVQEPSDSSISTPGTSGSSIPTPGPSESDIPTPGPSGSGIPTPGPSGSSIPTPGPSESGIPTPGPSGSGIPTPGPSGSGIPTPGPSGSGIPTPGPSGSGIPTPGPSGSGIPTPNITEGDDNDHSGTGKGLLSELWNFLRDGTSAEFKKMIETPEYTIPKRKTTETYHDVIIVDDQEVIIENIQSDDEVEVLQYEAGGRKTPAQQESSVPRFGLQQEGATEDAMTIVDGASTLTPGSTKDIDRFEAHSAPTCIDLTKSSTPMVDIPHSGQFSHTSTVPIDLTKTALQSDARVYSDSSEDMACDVIILQTLPGDVEITGVEPAPISGVSVAVSGNVSQTAVGPDDVSQTVAGPDDVSQTAVGPDDVSQSAVGPDDVSQTVAGPDDVSQTVAGPDDVSQTVAGPDDVSQTVAGPDDVSQTVAGPDDVSQSAVGPDDVSQTVAGPDDVSQTVAGPDDVSQTAVGPDDVSQTVAGPDDVSQTVAGPDDVSQSAVGPDDVSQTVAGPDDVSQTVAGPDDVSQTVAGPDDVSQTVAGPDDVSQTVAGPDDVSQTVAGPDDVSQTVAGPDDVSQTLAGPDDISQTVTGLGGPPQSVAAPDHVSQNMAGPDDVSETVTVPGDMTQTAVGPDDVSQTLAGSDNVSQTVLGIGGASLSVRSADQVNATAPGVTDNKQIHKTGDTEEADMDLDPEGTDKLPISELMELMTTPKRWKLVILYLDPIEIYDSLCIKKVITEREYFSTFKGCATKQDRIEKLKGGMEKNSIYVEEVITFIQNSRRTLLMKKILKADDATLKKMLEEQDPSDLLAKLRGGRLKRHWSRLLPFPAIKPTEQVTKKTALRRNVPDKPGDAGRASDDMVDWETGSYDVVKFTEAVQGGVDLGGYAALFQNKDFELERFPVNPLLIVATFGSSEAITYVHQLNLNTFNWNELLEIKTGVFEGILDDMKDRNATALYVATFMEKLETVGTLIKYADERNIVYCMNNIQLSISMEKVYMTEVGERLKREYSALKPAVVPGHQKESDGTSGRVFIVYSPDVLRATNHEKEGIGLVMVRNPYKVDREAVTVSDSKDADSDISRQDMERTKQAIASHSKTLWCNHSNLNIISVCSVRSKRKGAILEKSLCVVLYCSTKGVVPLGEEEFPTRLNFGDADSIGIDVREGYFEYGYNSQPSINRHEMLKMGCNIGEMTTRVKNGGGTLGPFVKYNGIMSFLTCAHVLFDVGSFCKKVDFTDTGSPRVRVVQPAADTSCPSGAPCGFVQRAIFDPNLDTSIDVAVVTISDPARRPTKGRFAIDHSYKYKTAGFKELPEYNNGSVYLDIATFGGSNMVVQFGSETHLTKGSLTVNGTQVRPLSTALGLPSGEDKVCMTNQYEVEGIKSRINFFLPGDSGSAVFMMYGTSLHCIGMAIGSMSNGNAVVTPIGALLNALGGPQCSIELAKFEDSSQQPCTSRIKRRYTKIDLKRQRFKSMKKK